MLFSSDLVAVPNGTSYLYSSRYGSVLLRTCAIERSVRSSSYVVHGVFLLLVGHHFFQMQTKFPLDEKKYQSLNWNDIKLCNNCRLKQKKERITWRKRANNKKSVKSKTMVFCVYVKWSLVVIYIQNRRATQKRKKVQYRCVSCECVCVLSAGFVEQFREKKSMVFLAFAD